MLDCIIIKINALTELIECEIKSVKVDIILPNFKDLRELFVHIKTSS